MTDRNRLDSSIGSPVSCCDELPQGLKSVSSVLPEIDVIWIERGSARLRALFEVEHSTPIYSGLLRFNDIHLVAPSLQATFAIVANDERRATFIQQLSRPTFKASGLSDLCTFMRYENVFSWYQRARAAGPGLT
jgi:type II restriction enzyme